MSTKILQKLTFQKNFVNLTCVRWKGHSKWQNIQHTKAEKDGQRSKLAWTYNRKIGVAIRENGNETDPDRNRSLARVLKEAIAQGVMQSTIDKAIKGFKSSNDVEGLFELRGPGRTGLIVEMIGSNEGNMRTILNTITKKHQAAIEIGVKNMFERKGIIICAKSISLEQAEELAIEFGAEEVEEEDEILNFYTSPLGITQLYITTFLNTRWLIDPSFQTFLK